eukprot:symbB.v1.2.000519.t1/scaffold31.1/size418471/15
MSPMLLRRWVPPGCLQMQEELRSDPHLQQKYELLDKLLATEQEDALFSASQIGPIREFQGFLLRRFQGRWTLQQASSLSVADVLTDWISEEQRPFATGLFIAAKRAWNIIAPRVRRFECQELEIPAMGEDPNEVSIMWWLRSERDDCPMCLQSLTLLRWLLHLHNDWLERAEECIEMRDDAPAEPCCLANALPPYFFQYEPGSLEQWAKEAAQPTSEKFDWALAASRARQVFAGRRRVKLEKIEMYHFMGEGRQTARPRFQIDLPEARSQLLLRLLSNGQQQDHCLQLLIQMEASFYFT